MSVVVTITLALLGEEADVMTLAAHNHNKGDVESWIGSLEQHLDVVNLLLDHVLILTFGDAVAHVDDSSGELALVDFTYPSLQQRPEASVQGIRLNHLNSETVALASSGIANTELVHRDSHSCHRWVLGSWRSVRDIRTDYDGWCRELATWSSRLGSDRTTSLSTELRVDLHADIRDVLRLALLDMRVLH